MPEPDQSSHSRPWWAPDRHADRRGFLLARGAIQRALRAWFEAEGFIEVETSPLQVSPGNEAHLHAFATEFVTESGVRRSLYLHTSPEFAMKKLLAAGETNIFTFAPCFRNREAGPLHAAQFTMLEWYRAGADYTQLMADCAAILALAARVTGRTHWTFRDRTCDATAPPERISLHAAFQRFADLDPFAGPIAPDGTPDRDELALTATRIGVRVAADDTWTDLFSRILGQHIEPALAGMPHPVLLDRYPVHAAALARRAPDDARVAERFELYACGVELANAFGELTDPVEQRRRLEVEMAEKQRVYGERYPIDEDFLAALAAMPPAAGAALGFDRLVMLAAGAPDVASVQWAPPPLVL